MKNQYEKGYIEGLKTISNIISREINESIDPSEEERINQVFSTQIKYIKQYLDTLDKNFKKTKKFEGRGECISAFQRVVWYMKEIKKKLGKRYGKESFRS